MLDFDFVLKYTVHETLKVIVRFVDNVIHYEVGH